MIIIWFGYFLSIISLFFEMNDFVLYLWIKLFMQYQIFYKNWRKPFKNLNQSDEILSKMKKKLCLSFSKLNLLLKSYEKDTRKSQEDPILWIKVFGRQSHGSVQVDQHKVIQVKESMHCWCMQKRDVLFNLLIMKGVYRAPLQQNSTSVYTPSHTPYTPSILV